VSTAAYDPASPVYQGWCQGVFDMLVDGGVWGVPRSGLIFTKRGETLVLTSPDVPTAEQLEDYDCIREHFAAAGLTVERA
jgi:hypothetical protein